MTFTEAKAIQAALETELAALSKILHAYQRGPMGITPDAIKFSPEFRAAKKACDTAFAKFRSFNGVFVKTFAKELRAERKVKFQA